MWDHRPAPHVVLSVNFGVTDREDSHRVPKPPFADTIDSPNVSLRI